jgi:hypothetical protein
MTCLMGLLDLKGGAIVAADLEHGNKVERTHVGDDAHERA